MAASATHGSRTHRAFDRFSLTARQSQEVCGTATVTGAETVNGDNGNGGTGDQQVNLGRTTLFIGGGLGLTLLILLLSS